MKKRIWGNQKALALFSLTGNKVLSHKKGKKVRMRKIIILTLREKRPSTGYKTYTVRRSKPYHTWNTAEMPEESKYFWKEIEEDLKIKASMEDNE